MNHTPYIIGTILIVAGCAHYSLTDSMQPGRHPVLAVSNPNTLEKPKQVPITVQIEGLVSKPGTYSLTNREPHTLIDLVFDAGGTSAGAKHYVIFRKDDDGDDWQTTRQVNDVRFFLGNPDLKFRLHDGDRVVVE